jgi:parvulin-like peptidyl-prolyl isomerase
VSFQRFLREPLLHFLLIGAALFAVHAARGPAAGGDEASRQIALSLDDLSQLALSFQAQWRRPPTPEELSQLVEEKIREEILYREALALGLDENDSIVKRRMAQKMQFLAEDVAAAHDPSAEELKAWYAENSEGFALPARVSFRHVYFSPDRRGPRTQADAASALGKLAGQPMDAPLAASLADAFMFQDYYGDRTAEQLAREFGPRFAQEITQLAPGSWQGPIESGYGWHLVFVDSRVPGRIPDFEEVEADVKTAWLTDQKEQASRKAYDEMRAKYTVLLPAPPEQDGP